MKWYREILFQNVAMLFILFTVALAAAIWMGPKSEPIPPLQVGPLVPASAEESAQWERDNLADTMRATLGESPKN